MQKIKREGRGDICTENDRKMERIYKALHLIKYYLDINLVKMIYMPRKSLILLFQTVDDNPAYRTGFNRTGCYQS